MVFSPLVSELVTEFIGTFLVTLPVPLASVFVGPLASLAVGFMTASMVYSFLFISGAHFNPAISFAMFISQRMSFKRFILYIIVQTLSAWLSTLYAAFPIGVDVSAPETADIAKAWKSISVEMAFTYAVITAYFHTCISKQRSNQYYGFAIGFAFVAAILCIPNGFNGSAFNPAIATSLQLTRCIQNSDYCIHLAAFWIHWLAPFVGAFVAILLYGILDTEAKPGEENHGDVVSSDNAPQATTSQQQNNNSGPQFQMSSEDYVVNNDNNGNGNNNGNANFY